MASPRWFSPEFVSLLLLGLGCACAVSHAGVDLAAAQPDLDETVEIHSLRSFAWRPSRQGAQMRGLLETDDEMVDADARFGSKGGEEDEDMGELEADGGLGAAEDVELFGNDNQQPNDIPQPDTTQGEDDTPRPETTQEGQQSSDKAQPETTQEQEDEQPQSPARAARARQNTRPFAVPNPHFLGPPIKDWDEQRAAWLEANPHFKTTPGGKPRVLIISGSPPWPCRSDIGDDFHIKSLKLKMDYARMHNYDIYYNLAWFDPAIRGIWVKLSIIRQLLLTHPEIEWFFWIDADAMFTDMLFEPPLHMYDDYDLIMWGLPYMLHHMRSWVSINDGSFMIRNSQWTLDLFDKWSPLGAEDTRQEYGKIVNAYFSDREDSENFGDQTALAYLILVDEAVRSKVKLVDERDYRMSGWWMNTADKYEDSMEKYHPGLGDYRCPWVTHFTGCKPCLVLDNEDTSARDACIGNFTRAYNFADNQVLAYMGYQHESLLSDELIRIRNETDRPIDFVGVSPWEERITEVAARQALSA